MKKSLLFLLFYIASINSNTFKIKNKFFEIEGTSDKNNNITYAELKRCNLDKDSCEEIKEDLLLIPTEHPDCSERYKIERINRTIISNTVNEVNFNRHMAVILINSGINCLFGIASLVIVLNRHTINPGGPGPLPSPTTKDLKNLVKANSVRAIVSSINNQLPVLNKPLIAIDAALGIANGVLIAKTIAVAASPWVTGIFIVTEIARSTLNLFYRGFTPTGSKKEIEAKFPSIITIEKD